ncbi:MAG: type I DNA topoisomerase [Clostridiales bacterium]|jgi:DNA topoisomerase-1|nr:type I DNA topoisomerase [Clostridiales bacterium]
MPKNLVIVESPAKAKTLKKFLGADYKIEASVGHVRDLPKSEIGIDVENDFEPKYITIRGKGEVLAKLRKEVKTADKVYLATDPDREGEAISWHLKYALKLDDEQASRITFNEITESAVTRSIQEARAIDMDLVNAQQARRELDRIVGYKISPLLWTKVRKRLSAGRVQSVALKMICDREAEIENFLPVEFWTIDAILKAGRDSFKARFYAYKGSKAPVELKDEQTTRELAKQIKEQTFIVDSVKKGTRTKNPVTPFTTSVLQQEASRALGFAAYKTMMIAQQLYEGVEIKGEGTVGLVSYIRTDSMRISDEAYVEVKDFILERYGEEYANKKKTQHKAKGRAQDAHEAIRPTAARREPEFLADSLSKDQYKLYKLIWERFVASQMTPAVYETVAVKIECGSFMFRASGSKLTFKGFLAAYQVKEEETAEEAAEEVLTKMPNLTEKQQLDFIELDERQHFTQPPPRYSEGALVRSMEEMGIGRPSTYAATISNIVSRGYVTKEKKAFFITELGEIVNSIMSKNFGDIVDINFTAKMEEELDQVEDGKKQWKEVLRDFYPDFERKLKDAEEKINAVEIKDEETDALCEECGRRMVVKFGRYGKFLACPGFPECRFTKPFFEDAGVDCPKCGSKVMIKKDKKSRKIYACEDRECDFVSWNKPSKERCPRCGGVMVEKGTKKKREVCLNDKCGYFQDKEDDESDE